MNTITLLFHAYIYISGLERGDLEWSYSVVVEEAFLQYII